MLGGSDGQASLSSVEIYDPDTDQWSTGPAMITPRVSLSATSANARLYALGGFSGKAFLDTIEYLDADTNEWCSYVPGEFS